MPELPSQNPTCISIRTAQHWLAGIAILLVTVGASAQQDVAQAVAAATDELTHSGFWSVLPPLLAIGLALLIKRVIPALFAGIWLGGWLIAGGGFGDIFQGLLDSFQIYVLSALADKDHAAIILFSMMIGGMVGIISANGGMQGVVHRIIHFARDAQRAAISTWFLGLAIFFDDYANTLVVGNTMRPLADNNRLSREKLAYIVDSTAAPVSCIALITTWIGYEVGLIQDAVAGLSDFNEQAYWIFLHTIPYSFYPLLTLFFVLLICLTDRDYGPMRAAELRARETGETVPPVQSDDDKAGHEEDSVGLKTKGPQRALNAVLPIVAMVLAVLYGLWITGQPADGSDTSLRDIIGSADSYKALMWGSLVGVMTAVILTVAQRLLSLEQTVQAWYRGVRSMLFAMVILLLAWALGEQTEVLGTAHYLVELLGNEFPTGLLPALIFVLAAGTAFATGSSWGAMGILLPLAIPLCWTMLSLQGMNDPEHYHVLYAAIASVLGGAVWGDHCSPISDTTILSSMATQCDHIEHVRTQLPYAMTVGSVAILLGIVPSGFGLPWWVCMAAAVVSLLVLLRVLGKPVPNYQPATTVKPD